jgi:NADH:ubiquinone oxidoreductase subunit 3 (subunit A)
MEKILLSPPAAFIILLLTCWILLHLFSRLAFRPKKTAAVGTGTAYACGEDNYDPMVQPDYSSFFPFAFFFTLAHVATLILTTVPKATLESFVLAVIYIIGAIIGLYILFRR